MISVLYVDDEPDLLQLGRTFLEKSGCMKVDTEISAIHALTRLETRHYDAIVSDYQMPDMDGIAFLKMVRESRQVPFILFTGKGREEVVIEALNNGADFYLQKGGEPRAQFMELSSKILAAVEVKEGKQQLLQVIQGSPIPTFVIDQDHRVLWWNKALEEYTGLTSKSITGTRDHWKAFYDHPRPCLADLVIDRSDDGLFRWYGGKNPRRSHIAGSYEATDFFPKIRGGTWLFFTAAPIYNASGEITGAIETLQDITEIRQTTEELRQFQDRLGRTQEIGHVASWEYNPLTRTVWASDEGLRIYGIPKGENVNPVERIEACIPDWRRSRQALSDLISHDLPYNLELVILPENGEDPRIIRSVAECVTDGSGKVSHVAGAILDITLERNAAQKLLQSEKRWRDLVDTLDSGVAIYEVLHDGQSGRDYIIKDFNKKALLIEGRTKEEVIGKSLFDLRPKIDDFGLIPLFHTVWKTGVPAYFPAKVYTDEHFSNWYENRVIRLSETEIAAIYTDVTEWKQREMHLQETDERYRALFERSFDCIYLHSLDGQFLDANEAALNLLGYSREDIPSLSISSLLSPGQRGKIHTALQELLTEGSQKGYSEYSLLHRDGREILVRTRSVLISRDGKPWAVQGIARDITEERRTEEALRSGEELFREVFNNANDAIFLHEIIPGGLPDRYILVNNKACQWLGYTREELLTMSPRDIVPKESRVRNMPIIQGMLMREGHATFQSVHQRKDGTTYPVEVSTHIFKLKGDLVAISIARDITKRI